jgi:hypothetical protein
MEATGSPITMETFYQIIQAETHATKASAIDNIHRGYRNTNIYSLSDCQAAIKAPDNYCETSIHRFRRGSEKETMDPGKQ